MLDGAKVSTSPPRAGERSVRGDARASAAPRYDVRWPQDSGFRLGPLSNTINVGAALCSKDGPRVSHTRASVGSRTSDRISEPSRGISPGIAGDVATTARWPLSATVWHA
jgi:hypothetical protein